VGAHRLVYFHELGEFVDTLVLRREAIEPEESVEGPAVIHQVDSTVLVPPGLAAVCHETGSMILAPALAVGGSHGSTSTLTERR
jgi:N-methylhydantoinase A